MFSAVIISLIAAAPAAAAPPGQVLATLETPDVPGAYKEVAEGRGMTGAATELVCRDLLADELLLCFRVVEAGKRRYVHAGDLTAWGVDIAGLEAAAAAALDESPLEAQPIDGGGQWWLGAVPAGREATLLLQPEWLAAVGPRPVVGVPAAGVVMAWSAGDEELDTIVAVGVRRAFETQERPISPLCLEWTGAGWKAWGEARPGATSQP